MDERWSEFQDLLAARDEINVALWATYNEADEDTKLRMSQYVFGPRIDPGLVEATA